MVNTFTDCLHIPCICCWFKPDKVENIHGFQRGIWPHQKTFLVLFTAQKLPSARCLLENSSISIKWHMHVGWQFFACGPGLEEKAATWVYLMTNAPKPIDWPVQVRDKKPVPLARRSQWPLNHPSLSSSGPAERLALSSCIKFCSTDKAGRCYQFVCPAWPITT